MRHRAGIEIAAQARHAAPAIADAIRVEAANRRIARSVNHFRPAIDALLVGVLAAKSGVGRPDIGDIILGAGEAKLVFDIAPRPLLAGVFAVTRHGRHEIDVADIDPHRTAVEGLLLVANIKGAAQALAAIIEANGGSGGAALIIFNRGFALAVQQVNAHPDLVVIAITPPDIQ